jgi:two-component system, NtrC family, response regulator AtoC
MTSARVLIVNDDESSCADLSGLLISHGYSVDCVGSPEEVFPRLMQADRPSVVIIDLLLPAIDGLQLLVQLRQSDRQLGIVVVTTVNKIETVVKAMQLGASDYVVKPFEDDRLMIAVENARKQASDQDEQRRCGPVTSGTSDIISVNAKMLRMREIAIQVAPADVPVLILGESGVGKDVLARFIHARSHRTRKPFVRVNCAALPNELLESELFGYERGAFTGAMQSKAGKFELADKGTILLDEIGEMTPHLQAKLLHVLQDGEFTRLGGTQPQRTDARVLAATNKRLEDAVAKGEFREDLFFRLNVITLRIPPLRQRREDILPLCSYFFERYRHKYGAQDRVLPDALLEAFTRYHWPGNVRQLESAIKRYLILPDLDLAFDDLKEPTDPAESVKDTVSVKELAAHAAEQAEKQVILKALEETKWNRKEVARDLNMCYKTLLNKLRKWQVNDNPDRATTDTAVMRKTMTAR